MKTDLLGWTLAAGLFLTSALPSAHGQTVPAAPSAPSAARPADEGVIKLDPFKVVTGGNVGYGAQMSSSSSRMNLRYIDVPQTVNVVTEEFLADAFLFDSRDFTKFLSGVAPRTNTHQAETFFMRGLQTTTSYVEGFLAVNAVNRDAGLYNRVEYVKGPASAAIGRGEAGGLVNFIQKKPTGQTGGAYKVMVGTDDFYRGELDYNGVAPFGGRIPFRVPVYYEESNDPRGGPLLRREKWGIGPAFTWRPFAQTEVNVTAALFSNTVPGAVASAHWMHLDLVEMRIDQNGINPALWFPGPGSPLVPYKNVFTYEDNFKRADVREINTVITQQLAPGLSLRQGLRAEFVRHRVQRFNSPPAIGRSTAFPSGYFVTLQYVRNHDEDYGLRSQTDFAATGRLLGAKHTLLGGFDIFERWGSLQSGTRTGLRMDLYRPDTTPAPGFDPQTFVALNANTDQKNWGSGYGYYTQYSGEFWHDRIQVMAGWRRDFTDAKVANLRNGARTFASAATAVPRYSVSFKPRDWLTAYYVHSEQEDPPVIRNRYGAFIPLAGATVPANDPREQELLIGQVQAQLDEVGVKSSLFGGRITASVSLYEMTRDGFIQNEVKGEPGPGGIGTLQYTQNYLADGEKVQGVEFEVFGQPTARLTFTLAASFPEGTNPRANGTVQPIDTITDEYSLHAKYSFRDANRNGFEFTGGGKYWVGGWTISNGSFFTFDDDQHQLDIGAGYFWKKGRYSVNLRVNNVFDDVIYITENSQWTLRRAFLSFTGRF